MVIRFAIRLFFKYFLLSIIYIIGSLFLVVENSLALDFNYLAQSFIPSKTSLNRTQIGGISAITYLADENLWVLLSDDKGQINEPRFYKAKIDYIKKNKGQQSELIIQPSSVHFLNIPESSLHSIDQESFTQGKFPTFGERKIAIEKKRKGRSLNLISLDLEGVCVLPWGGLLFTSEGFNNSKPRIPPLLFETKVQGNWVRNYLIPEKFIPNSTGHQKKGIENNRGFEGLSISPSGKLIMVATEGSLIQDKPIQDKHQETHWNRLILYSLNEPFQIKKAKEVGYELDSTNEIDNKGEFIVKNGISEVLFLDEEKILVLERGIKFSLLRQDKKMEFYIKIYLIEINGADDISQIEALTDGDYKKLKPVKKKLALDLNKWSKEHPGVIPEIYNFEGMAWLQEENQKTSQEQFGGDDNLDAAKNSSKKLILVSDNNLKKDIPTTFLLFEIRK